MSKAKEYKKELEAKYQKFKNQIANGFAQELRGKCIVAYTMNHKTLEDVEKLINKYQQHLFHGDKTFNWLKDELEKLKL